ncbi:MULTISPECIES: helix-turn-helix domain-containing protein [Cupriavidus]
MSRNGNNGKSRTQAECERLLAGLRHGPLNSVTAASVHAIRNVSHCVTELRRQGHRITSRMVWHVTPNGKRSKVARYSLEAA